MLGVFATILLAFVPSYAVAQTATCVAEYWTYNSEGQSPCVVASGLRGVCGGDPVPQLPPGYYYSGPTIASRTECICNSVYYSMLSACSTCQQRVVISWSEYSTNCSTAFLQSFPDPIPEGLRIPHYAYLNVSIDDTFNATLAKTAGGSETTGLPSSTTTTPTTTTSSSGSVFYVSQTSPVSQTGFASQTSAAASASKQSDAGAIAGGVVGGLVVIALAVGVVVWLLKRQPKASPESAQYHHQLALPPPPQMTYAASSLNTGPQQQIYNPNNPTTFPTNQLDPRFSAVQPSPNPHQPSITTNYSGNALPEV